VLAITDTDLVRIRDHVFFEGPEMGRRLSRFWVLLVLAAVIAAAGVVGDSVATVIGAMIVAPLMVPILGTLVAVVLADRTNLLRCLGLVVAGAAAVLAISFVVGLLVPNPVVAATNTQVAARVSPRLVDLLAALATGAVGSIALARDDIADTLPGVAIAISLVPPLAVVGLTLESGETDQALGALLLFTTNVSAILAAGLVVMFAYRVHHHTGKQADGTIHPMHRRRAVAVIVACLAVICIPLTLTSQRVSHATLTERDVRDASERWIAGTGWELVSVAVRRDAIEVTVTGPLPGPDPAGLRHELDHAGRQDLSVAVELVPSQRAQI
jgi:uncharacterized hydrophobic protein (TIGR00271 family)